MSTLLDTLISYVPPLTVRRFADNPTPLLDPAAEHFPATALFADISGFTEITEALAQRGPVGAEELTLLLNNYFSELIALISEHGGEIIEFAGDGLLALWPADDEDLALTTLRASQCALSIQSSLHDTYVAGDVPLALHIGIGAGEIAAAHVGGMFGHWALLVGGAPLVQVSLANQQAMPGEIILSPEAWELVEANCAGQALDRGGARLIAVRIHLPERPVRRLISSSEAEEALRTYIPSSILARLDAGMVGWLAELRRMTVLFINLPELDYTTPLERAQAIMSDLQTALYHYEGSINKLHVDDKGTTLIAALGLPPLAHEDDAVRALRAALAIRAEFKARGLRSAIGVATGRAFCGVIGSMARREYTMIGDVVNLAARLMQAASDDLLCDGATFEAAKDYLIFEDLPSIVVKGKAVPVAVYRPQGESRRARGRQRAQTPIVGRLAERDILGEEIQGLARGKTGRPLDAGSTVIVIEGEAGIGKTRLVEELGQMAEARRMTCLVGWGDAVEQSTPYHAWRGIFGQVLDVDWLADLDKRQQQVLKLLASEPSLVRLAPLLNPILSLDIPDNDLTSQMSGQVRAENTRELLVQLLRASIASSPKVVILEDAHLMDSASWALALAVSQRVQPLLLVIVTRPLPDPPPAEYPQLLARFDTQHLKLDRLTPAQAVALVCQRLGVSDLPESVVELIQQKAEGHPFFSEEIAYALYDSGLLVIEGGRCEFAPGAGDLPSLPDTIQGVVTSRIDRLGVREQLTLKVASVIGRVFGYRILHDVHPLPGEKERLHQHLELLSKLNITQLETPPPDLKYIFKHAITREASYDLMTYDQRRQLHRAVAEWYERTYVDDLAPFYPLLAHHWSKAEAPTQAIVYLERAGDQAMHHYANREAIRFYNEALALDAQEGIFQGQVWRARCKRQLGEAFFGLGNRAASNQQLWEALALLGCPVPSSNFQQITGVLRQLILQAWHRVRHPDPTRYKESERSALREAALALERLGEIAFFDNQTIPTVYAILHSLNLSEQIGPSPELARACASTAIAMSIVRQHKLADDYLSRAQEIIAGISEVSTQARVQQVISLIDAGIGRWDQAMECAEGAIEKATQLGDLTLLGGSLALLAIMDYHQGFLQEAIKIRDYQNTVAQRASNVQHRIWFLSGQSANYLRMGREPDQDKPVPYLEEAARLLSENQEGAVDISVHGLLAYAYLRQGDLASARRAADQVLRTVVTTTPTVFSSLDGLCYVPEVYLALWEAGPKGSGASQLARSALSACKAMHAFSRIFPIGQPRAWLCQGLYDWLSGRPRRAQRAWHKSLIWAENLHMPHDHGLARYEIGRHLKVSDPDREKHLAQAYALFHRIGAAYDMERVQQELDRTIG